MRRNMNKLLALALTAALCLSLLPGTARAEAETLSGTQTRNGITVTADGEAQFTYEAGSGFILGNGSYTVSGTWGDSEGDTLDPQKAVITVPADVTADVTLKGATIDVTKIDHACAFAIAPKASAQVTLEGESSLKSGRSRAGLEVPEKASLTIAGDGSISAWGGNQGAAIGGVLAASGGYAGEITINSGTVLATGGGYSAGIGAGGTDGSGGSGGKITINGGTVTAKSGGQGAGIGGAWGNGGEIAIHGGEVTATGEVGGAGIGGGIFGTGGTITITGGSVRATGSYADNGYGSAAIGGGGGWRNFYSPGQDAPGAPGGTIVITGTAQVTAIGGGDNANSVGPGNGNTDFDTYIRTVALKEGSTAKEGTADDSLLLGAAGNTLEVKGAVSLTWDLVIPTGTTLTIPDGASLTIPEGITLTNNGTIDGTGILTGDGVFDGDGEYRIKVSLTTAAVTGLTPPAAGAAPDTDAAVAEGANYSVTSVTWSSGQTPHTGNFDYETVYTASVTVTAKNAYSFTAATGTINGEAADVDGSGSSITLSYTFPDTGSAPYTPSTYAITPTAGEGGTIDPAKRVSVRSGKDQTFTITPAEGYAVADVLVDGKSVGAVTSYTFEKVRARHTIEVLFAPRWENPFTDVAEEDWFYDDVACVHGKGLMLGTAPETFAPDSPVTRATLATTLWRLAGQPQGGEGSAFTDIPDGAWYGDAVRWAAAAGVTQGVGEGRFAPDAVVTREQMVTILHRFARYQERDVSAGESTNILSYTDAFDVAEWAIPGFQWACGTGLVEGVETDKLAPQGELTRSQLAALLHRYMEA